MASSQKVVIPLSIARMGDGSFRVRGLSARSEVSLTKMADWHRGQDRHGYFYSVFNARIADAFADANGLRIAPPTLS